MLQHSFSQNSLTLVHKATLGSRFSVTFSALQKLRRGPELSTKQSRTAKTFVRFTPPNIRMASTKALTRDALFDLSGKVALVTGKSIASIKMICTS